MYQKTPVVAFERHETYEFESISDAALAYGINKKVVIDRIKDGCTLKDGYTTLDYLFKQVDVVDDSSD